MAILPYFDGNFLLSFLQGRALGLTDRETAGTEAERAAVDWNSLH